MICAFCGHEFDAGRAAPACAQCAASSGCHMVRCPKCGYEAPSKTRLGDLAERVRNFINNRIGS